MTPQLESTVLRLHDYSVLNMLFDFRLQKRCPANLVLQRQGTIISTEGIIHQAAVVDRTLLSLLKPTWITQGKYAVTKDKTRTWHGLNENQYESSPKHRKTLFEQFINDHPVCHQAIKNETKITTADVKTFRIASNHILRAFKKGYGETTATHLVLKKQKTESSLRLTTHIYDASGVGLVHIYDQEKHRNMMIQMQHHVLNDLIGTTQPCIILKVKV